LGDPQDAYTKELLTAIPHPPLPALIVMPANRSGLWPAG